MRWIATIYYRANAGLVDVEHAIEELHELADLVERGPHWDCIDHIEIRLSRPAQNPGLAVEQADEL